MNYQQQQSQIFPTYPTENSGDINWAQLAQRWIQTQHSQQQPYPTQPPPPPPPPPPPSRLPYSHVSSAPMFHGMPSPSLPPNRTPGPGFPTPLSHVSVGPPNWRPPQNCAHPSFNIGYQSHGIASGANYSYFPQAQGPSGRHDDEEYQAHYDPSLEQEEPADQRTPEMCAPQGPMPQWMPNPWNAGMYPPNYMPIIDTHMRKKLPAWILEGLEKAEREKQKKIEKEEFEKKRKEREEEKQRQREAKGIGKFDEDSNDDEDEGGENETDDAPKDKANQSLPIRKFREFVDKDKRNGAEMEDDPRTEEQRTEEALVVVRRLMTTVLLETTDREIKTIAGNALTRKKNKAQPKILAQSTALSSLASLVDNREKRRSVLGIDAISSSSAESGSDEEKANRKRKSKRKHSEETKARKEPTKSPVGKRSRK